MAANSSILKKVIETSIQKNYCKQPIQFLIYNNFDPVISSMLLFLFSAGEKSPGVVIKICKTAGIIKKEYGNLRILKNQLNSLVPEPLFFNRIDSFEVMAMEMVKGNHLDNLSVKSNLLSLIVDKMIIFHKTVQKGNLEHNQLNELINQSLNSINSKDKNSPLRSFYSNIIKELSENFDHFNFPKIPQHGDFFISNILFNSNGIYILDWEDFGQICIPGYDLYFLLLDLFANERFLAERLPHKIMKIKNSIKDNIKKYFESFSIPLKYSRFIFIITLLKQFEYSYRLGRSSIYYFWNRLMSYAENTEKYDHLFVI